jgi:aspartate aminotransferase
VIGPPEVIDGVLRVQGHATSNPTSFAMAGALAALAEPEAAMAARLAEFHLRRDLVAARLQAMPGVRCTPPAGAFYAFPDVSGCFDDELGGSLAIARYLLDSVQVAVVPGVAFGADAHVRVAFAASRETLAAGLDRMAEALGERLARHAPGAAAHC